MKFFQSIVKRWWVIITILAVTVIFTLLFTNGQTPIYSSAATFVVSPASEVLDENSFLSGLAVLGGQPTVANTYASIATSAYVKQKASEALGLTPAQAAGLSVFSRVRTGTNVIEISVEGTDPLLVQTFAHKIGESTIDYISNLKGVYDLKPLDDAASPDKPIRPNKSLYLILGTSLGLALGGGIAFIMGLNEY